jgi:hypothetical protein
VTRQSSIFVFSVAFVIVRRLGQAKWLVKGELEESQREGPVVAGKWRMPVF